MIMVVIGDALDGHEGIADLDAEQPGLLLIGQHRDHPLDGLDAGHPVPGGQQVVDAVIKRLSQQVRRERYRDARGFQGDPHLVGHPDPDHLVYQRARRDAQGRGRGVVGGHHPRGHHVGAGPEALGSQVRGYARQVAEVDIHPGTIDEGAAGAAPAAVHEALVLEPVQDLPDGGAAHRELLGQLAFGRQPPVLAQLAGGDELLDVLLDRIADSPGILGPRNGISLGLTDTHTATIDGYLGKPACAGR
jgi:hypothetical protein